MRQELHRMRLIGITSGLRPNVVVGESLGQNTLFQRLAHLALPNGIESINRVSLPTASTK